MTLSLEREARLARCPHCGATVDGPEDRYCCSGCEAAAGLLGELGLETWYEQRAAPAPRPEPLSQDWTTAQVDRIGSRATASLAIDGLRCSSCTWVVERVLEKTPGVESAKVSYASGRATLTFDTEATALPQIAERVARLGYRPRPVSAEGGPDPLFANLGVALFATANLMLLTAALYTSWLQGIEERFEALFRWGALALATPIAIYSAAPFWRGASQALSNRSIGMDVPIALAVGVLYGHGVVNTILGGEAYLDSLGMLVSLLLAGRLVEARGRRSNADAAAAIAAKMPTVARRRTATGVEEVAAAQLRPGDVLELGPGSEIAADARILEGELTVQTSMLTGEVEPKRLGPGDQVLAGCVVLLGTGSAETVRAGGDTVAMEMAEALRTAIDRPTAANPADRLAPIFTALTVLAAFVAGGVWTALTDARTGIEVAVAVLVVACPCALGLSVPLAVSHGLGALARRGLLLTDGDALLRLAEVDTIALDKTGTLTLGSAQVIDADDEVLRLAAGLERASHHPIARAIAREAVRRDLPLPLATGLEEQAGVGVSGRIDGIAYTLRSGGSSRVELRREGELLGTITLSDTLRDDVGPTLAALKREHPVAVLSGDTAEATSTLTGALGVEGIGGLLPQDKADWIAARREAGERVLFVGDGLNDGLALEAADVGLAMHAGVGAALGVADGVITGEDLQPVAIGLRAARYTKETVRTNLRRSLVYNAVAVTAAALGWINPLIAAVLMPISSAMVLIGSGAVERRLRKETP